jgi:hypothetical protein
MRLKVNFKFLLNLRIYLLFLQLTIVALLTIVIQLLIYLSFKILITTKRYLSNIVLVVIIVSNLFDLLPSHMFIFTIVNFTPLMEILDTQVILVDPPRMMIDTVKVCAGLGLRANIFRH